MLNFTKLLRAHNLIKNFSVTHTNTRARTHAPRHTQTHTHTHTHTHTREINIICLHIKFVEEKQTNKQTNKQTEITKLTVNRKFGNRRSLGIQCILCFAGVIVLIRSVQLGDVQSPCVQIIGRCDLALSRAVYFCIVLQPFDGRFGFSFILIN